MITQSAPIHRLFMTFQHMVARASLHNVPCELAPAHAWVVDTRDQLGPPVCAPDMALATSASFREQALITGDCGAFR